MATLTMIGPYAFCLYEEEWNDKVKKDLLEIVPAFFVWEQKPFVYLIDPEYVASSYWGMDSPFGLVHHAQMLFASNEGTEPVHTCTICPNRLRREVSSTVCQPCKPNVFEKPEWQWGRGNQATLKKHVRERGHTILNRKAFYFSQYPPHAKEADYRRGAIVDLRLLPPALFEVEHEEDGDIVEIHFPFWDVHMSHFHIYRMSITAEKMKGDDHLVYVSSTRINMSFRTSHTFATRFERSGKYRVMETLEHYRVEHVVDSTTALPYTFLSRYDPGTKEERYGQVETAPPFSLAIQTGVSSYFIDKVDRVYEQVERSISSVLPPRIGEEDIRDRYVFDGERLYQEVGTRQDLRFDVNVHDEVMVHFDPDKNHLRTQADVLTEGYINTTNFRVVDERLKGKKPPFVIGKSAFIESPTPYHHVLAGRKGEVLEIGDTTVTLGFEQNFFRETFEQAECFPLKS